ncbi:MAG: hypothetical protein OQL06_12250 [Gammaproteobacteria bacterium]|nr:hypothetical protein [Gammaproteobacteria bacterium]
MKLLQIPLYLICFFLMYNTSVADDIRIYTSLSGVLLFFAALYLSFRLHGPKIRPRFCIILKKYNTHPLSLVFLGFSLIWGSASIIQNSQIIAALSVAALLTSMALAVETAKLCYAMGFTERTTAPRTAIAAIILLILLAGIKLTGSENAFIYLFIPGIMYIAIPAYFIALLVSASKHYVKEISTNYYIANLAAIISGGAVLSHASINDLTQVKYLAGIFLALFLIEKLTDFLPVKTRQN